MTRKTMWKPLSIGVALVFVTAVGCTASGQDVRESGNPNAVQSKDAPGPRPTDSGTYQAQLGGVERSNPNAVQNKDRSPMPPADDDAANAQARAAEQGAPDSADNNLPTPTAILQRVHAFDQGSIALGQLALRNGGSSTQAYAGKLIDARQGDELSVLDLSNRLHANVDPPTDMRARKIVRETENVYARLQTVTGAQFDHMFAKHMNRRERVELEQLQRMRSRSVDPQVNDLLDRVMLPDLQRSVANADALTAAVAEGDPRP